MKLSTFWEIVDHTQPANISDTDLHEKLLIDKLSKYSEEDIVDFEIILRQLIDEADHYQVMAAQKIINGWVTDDSFLYFRCWLIAQGEYVFYSTLKNADFLADIVMDSQDTNFKELLSVSTSAYQIKSGKQEEDDTFPRAVAVEKHSDLDYNFGGSGTKGEEWEKEDLPKLFPRLSARFQLMPNASKNPMAAFKALLSKINVDPNLASNPDEAVKAAMEMLNNYNGYKEEND